MFQQILFFLESTKLEMWPKLSKRMKSSISSTSIVLDLAAMVDFVVERGDENVGIQDGGTSRKINGGTAC